MTTDIHRLLDERFAGITVTPATQDLKEEIRANLLARVEELTAAGVSPREADEQAMAELGDIRELLDPDATSVGAHGASPGMTPLSQQRAAGGLGTLAERMQANRVRPKPGYVARAVAWSTLLLAGLVLATLGATDVLSLPIGPVIALLGVAATGAGLLVGDSLSQETTTNHPMPEPRASGYALASWLALYGLGFAGLIALDALPLWCLVFAVVGVVAAIGGFVLLGVTQTNRHKSWTRAARADLPANRFETEPEAAARFGIYTAAIWIVALVATAVLTLTVGWRWAPLPLAAGLAAMFVALARMMFPPSRSGAAPHR